MSTSELLRRTPLSAKIDILGKSQLFSRLPAADLEKIAGYMHTRHVRREEPIFLKGDPGSGLMAVLAGTVKITTSAPDGGEMILNLMRPGDIFGEIALLDGRERTADAIAMTDVDLLVIHRRDFLAYLSTHPAVALDVIDVLCQRLRHTSERMEDLMFLEVEERLAKTLVHLAKEKGGRMTPDQETVIAITQKDLGKFVRLSRESTNRQLRAWENDRIVRIVKGGIIIADPRKLHQRARLDPDA